MKQRICAVVVGVATLFFTLSCGLAKQSLSVIVNEPENYLEAEERRKISVPQDLEKDNIGDVWEIPEIELLPASKYYPASVPRPVSIVGEADPNLIRIQKLGDRSWMVVQRKPDTVWPLVRQFLNFNEVEVESERPSDGVIVTKPLAVTEVSKGSLLHSLVRAEHAAATDDDFLVFRVEQGMRRGSSEVHLRYLNDQSQLNYVDWSLSSPQSEIANAILRLLAQFEVDDVSSDAVSRIGQEVAPLPKIELFRDEMGFPMLRFNVDFERTWATVISALERSPYGVATKEREERLIELAIEEDKLDRNQREMLVDLLVEIKQQTPESSPLLIQLKVNPYEKSNEIEMKRSDGTPLTLELAEYFLITIQQFST